MGLALAGATSLAALASADDRADAGAALKELEAVPASASLTREMLDQAKSALARADGARSSGDQTHGAMLEALALEWTLSAKELVRTAKVEREVVALQKKAGDLETKAVRAQALVEQTVARRGRAEEKLRELETGTAAPAAAAAPAPAPAPAAAPAPAPSPKAKP